MDKYHPLKLPSSARTSSHRPKCYAISIDNLGPIQIPAFYVPQNQSNGKIEIKLHCSIFDSTELSFVGRTWKSDPFPTNRVNQAIPIQKFWIYLKSVPYESKWVILELVAQNRTKGVIINQISLGWTAIKLFTNTRALVDVHPDENQNDPLQRESKIKSQFLFQGSPSYLLINNDITSIPETAVKISYRLFTFKKLIRIAHLVSPETLIGPNNTLRGMGHGTGTVTGSHLKIPSTPYDKKWTKLFAVPFTVFTISSPMLTVPPGFESDILKKLTFIRKCNFGGNQDTSATIKRRELNISIYNGRSVITIPTIIQLHPQSSRSSVLGWDGDVKLRVHADVKLFSYLLICNFYIFCCTLHFIS